MDKSIVSIKGTHQSSRIRNIKLHGYPVIEPQRFLAILGIVVIGAGLVMLASQIDEKTITRLDPTYGFRCRLQQGYFLKKTIQVSDGPGVTFEIKESDEDFKKRRNAIDAKITNKKYG